MEVTTIFTKVAKELEVINLSPVQEYINFLNKIKDNPKNLKVLSEEEYKKEFTFLENQLKEVFKKINIIADNLDLNDDLFYTLRIKLTKERRFYELPISSNLDTFFSIAKNYDFKLHLYHSRESLRSLLQAFKNFKDNLEEKKKPHN